MTKHLEQCVKAVQRFASISNPVGIINGFYKNFEYIAEDLDVVIAYAIVSKQKAAENKEYSDMYEELYDLIYIWAREKLKGRYLKRFMKEVEHEG